MQDVIRLITDRLTETGRWTLKTEELEGFIDPVTLYRAVYECGLIGQDVFGPESAGELVSLMERAGHENAEKTFRESGVFLSHEDRMDLTELFVRRLRQAAVLHLPDPEIFRSMLSQFRRYDLAESAYCENFLPVAPVVRDCASEFSSHPRFAVAATAQLTTAWYLQTLVDRQIVVLSDLAPALFELLRAVGRQEGALPPLGQGGESRRGAGRSGDGRAGSGADDSAASNQRLIAEALKTLELPRAVPTKAQVQANYRRLIRRYHPDVNPRGLEMAKRVNAAYALLVTTADSA